MTYFQLITLVDSTGYTVVEVRILPSEVQMDVISPCISSDESLFTFSVPLEDDDSLSSRWPLLYGLFLNFLPD